jgi:hypothetical protein
VSREREFLVRGTDIDMYGDLYQLCKSTGFADIAEFLDMPVNQVKHYSLYPLKAPGGPLGKIAWAQAEIELRKQRIADLDAALAAGVDPWRAFATSMCGYAADWDGTLGDFTNDQIFGLFVVATLRGWDAELAGASEVMDTRAGEGTASAMASWMTTPDIDFLAEAHRRVSMKRIVVAVPAAQVDTEAAKDVQ